MTITIDPKNIVLKYGPLRVTGFAKDTYISIEYNSDLFTLSMGAEGQATRNKTNDKSARVTITLTQGSVGNAALMGAMMADDADNKGALPLSIVDGATGSSWSSEGAWVSKVPSKEFTTGDGGNLEWILETDKLIPVIGVAV